jgi:hypothetical protein
MRIMPAAHAPALPLSSLRRTLSIVWALIPLCTLGIGTVVIIGSAAIRLPRRSVRLAAVGYLVVFVAVMIVAPTQAELPKEALRNDIAMWTWFCSQWIVGTIHAFFLRSDVFRPRPPVSPIVQSPTRPHPSAVPLDSFQSPAPRDSHSAWDPWGTDSAASRLSDALGEIGPYRLLSKLGQGGQGTVYLAQSPDGRQLAVKVLHPRITGGAGERDGFMREALAAQRVPPFSTARLIDVGVIGDVAYIVSEYVPGVSLERRVHDGRPLDGDSLTRLAIATSAALRGIHAAGIVHRDFKPANILLGPDGPRVIDFGIAKALDRMTMTSGGFKGTLPYMSPEQVSGRPVGPESDMFSWASTMIYAATGRLAFGGSTQYHILNLILTHHPDLSALPYPMRGPVAACLDKDPHNRPAAAELMVAITR